MMIWFSGLWLGILTSISPCPLATNVAAVSFLSKKIGHPRKVFLSGLGYTLGRVAAYAALGMILVFSMAEVPAVANFLQLYMNRLLGPFLIIVGLFLLDILSFNFPSFSISSDQQKKLADSGFLGAFALGVVFALSFCPISAALFFGSLIPLAASHEFGLIFPFLYGVGTGLPVLIFAAGIALGARSMAQWFNKVGRVESSMRRITGGVFIAAGLYYVWNYVMPLIPVCCPRP